MEANIPRLEAALEGLERRLFDQRAPAGRLLKAGLSDGEIDVFTANLPFELSDELRCYYRWHDGVDELPHPDWPYIPAAGILAPLYRAVQDYAMWAATPPIYDFVYQPTWFPINERNGIALVVDCGVEPGQASPIHIVDVKAEWREDRAPSLLTVIDLWNQMIDDGYWVYDTETADWDNHFAQIPLGIRRTGLVG